MATTTYYTINPFSAIKEVVEVSQVEDGVEFAPVGLAIRIPNDVLLSGAPFATLNELLQVKSNGILGANRSFSSIVMDPCLDVAANTPYQGVPGVNTSQCSGAWLAAGNTSHHLPTANSYVTFQTVTLPSAPASCLMVWEVYSINVSEDADGLISRRYWAAAASDVACTISFTGTPTINVPHGQTLDIDPALRGTALTVRFTSTAATPIYLGSWAFLY